VIVLAGFSLLSLFLPVNFRITPRLGNDRPHIRRSSLFDIMLRNSLYCTVWDVDMDFRQIIIQAPRLHNISHNAWLNNEIAAYLSYYNTQTTLVLRQTQDIL
jgi:hypothetical protein